MNVKAITGFKIAPKGARSWMGHRWRFRWFMMRMHSSQLKPTDRKILHSFERGAGGYVGYISPRWVLTFSLDLRTETYGDQHSA